MISSHSVIFTLDFIHQISQAFIIQQNIFILIMTCWRSNILIYTLVFFYAHYYHLPKKEYIFGFNQTNSLIVILAVSSFILQTTDLFE